MTNPLAGLAYDNAIANETDSLGSSVRESGAAVFTIKVAYFETSKNGALGLNLTLVDENNRQYKETLWATNRNGQNFYVTQSGEKKYLAGFIHADAITLLANGTPLAQTPVEKLVVKVYNRDAKAEVPTQVDALKAIMGKQIMLGILKIRENANKLNESTGRYEPTNEERTLNSIDKVFRADGFTTAELRSQAEEATFLTEWKARWEGKLRDKFKEVAGAARPGAPKAAAARGSMFN